MKNSPENRLLPDETVEQIIGDLLRGGVLLSAIVVLAGGILYLRQHGMQQPAYSRFMGEPASLCSVKGIVGWALQGRSRGIIQLGLLLLIATPIARVAFSLIAFMLQRDRIYVFITAIVLAVLLFSLNSGGFHP
jgi:uncharacterized membrane protein